MSIPFINKEEVGTGSFHVHYSLFFFYAKGAKYLYVLTEANEEGWFVVASIQGLLRDKRHARRLSLSNKRVLKRVVLGTNKELKKYLHVMTS